MKFRLSQPFEGLQNKSNILNILRWSLLLVYAWFCWLMLKITGQYVPYAEDVAFLRIKQEAAQRAYYLPVFYVHVYTSMLVLLAGFTQFSTSLRRRFPQIHRSLGYVYLITVIFLSGPSGGVMGWHANGGFWSQLAFVLLALLWIVFTLLAWRSATQKDWAAHAAWMTRSFALALSAITLRIWKYVLVFLFAPRPMDVYRVVAWLGWTLNLAIAEWLIWRWHKKEKLLPLRDT